ncbi:hypothetical protein [Paraflavitalea pollutisoli]|uniref:hypothetical protein n=1 Tax=Paraflavitalea pollutisoli TaxID=3034143 RepID=UPI0023EC00AF|nr:hypothetical protein [Paraflavitalea sp. H1-2-19X]
MKITKGHYYLAAIIAVGIILGAIIFRGGANLPPNKEDGKQVKAVQEQLQKVELAKAADSIRLVRRADSLQSITTDLKNKKEVVDRELAGLRKDRQRISNKLDTARANRDTVGYISACDSLQDRTRLQDEVIEMYQVYADSVDAAQEAQLDAKDSLLQSRQDLITQLRSANSLTYDKYIKLSSDYTKARKKLKRERTLSRALAAGAAVLGGLLIFK